MDNYHLHTSFLLYATAEQESLFRKTVGCSRFVYNNRVAERKANHLLYTEGKEQKPLTTEKQLKVLYPWLSEVNAQSLVAARMQADQAFTNCFKHGKGYPKFRKRDGVSRFTLQQTTTANAAAKQLRLAKLDWCKARGSFDQIVGRVKSITVKLEAGKWYASVLQELTAEQYYKPKACDKGIVGIDVGVVQPLTLSYGNDQFKVLGKRTKARLEQLEYRRKRHQRIVARRQPGSNNREKAKLRVAKDYQYERRVRKDFIEKTSNLLASNFDTVVFEDLKLANMTRSARGTRENPGKNVRAKAALNREMLRMGFGSLIRRTNQKCERYGSQVVKVNPYNTSRTCYDCGTIDKLSRKSQSRFHCVHCGFKINADVNAAHNIRRLGTSLH